MSKHKIWFFLIHENSSQLVHGEHILSLIEHIPTHYQDPLKEIKIIRTGVYLEGETFIKDNLEDVEYYLDQPINEREDNVDLRYVTSEMSAFRYKRGLYYHCYDLQSNLPFIHLPEYLLRLYESCVQVEAEQDFIPEEQQGMRCNNCTNYVL